MKTKHLRNVIIAIALVLAGALGTYLLIGSDEEKTEQNVPVNKIELADKIAVAKLKKDTAEVFRLYYDAAQRGDVESQYHLGVCYYNGEGVELSREESVKWFRKAAEQGYADAQYMCGALSESEEDVAKWYYRAAEQGHTVAQTLLGMCYEEGYGVAQSYDEAEKWYRKAAEQGVEEAKQALEELEDERKRKEEYARTHGTINGHDYVDLGLSVKWATCNVGASSPEGYGDYYAYGETTTKDSYTKENCTNYSIIMVPISGDVSYDVACKKWGGTWRLPSIMEFKELVENCTWEWTSQKGINGYKVTSKKNGNSIFLPAAGWRRYKMGSPGGNGSYWSGSPYPDFFGEHPQVLEGAHYLFFSEKKVSIYEWDDRSSGYSVRPVCTAGDDSERKADEERKRQEAASNSLSTRTFTVNGVSFKMVAVDGGTFTMGATSEQQNPFGSEKTVHDVTLSDYFIGETEVTQALWQAVMGNNPSYFSGSNNPVEEVSYDDCITFINKLNSLLSGQLPSGRKFRLPTEAEWEFAARGGNRSRGNQYSGSNSLGSVAWYDDNSNSQTHSVKQKQANELGLYDMSGNVWEWCYDWYGKYSSSSQTNPKGPSSGSCRVLRGGGWYCNAQLCRVANRNSYYPDYHYYYLGLRLAL